MALKKLCSYSGCKQLINYEQQYCDKHKAIAEQQRKDRYKDYKNKRIQDKNEKKYNDFYNSKGWIRLRDLVKIKQFGIDILEYYKTGKVIVAERYHHVIELREDWSSRLDINNLIGLTEQNHRIIHAAYNKSDDIKIKTQQMLMDMLDKFYKEVE